MLKLTDKSCGLYCQAIHAHFMTEMQELDLKLHISVVSIPDHSFNNQQQTSITLAFLMLALLMPILQTLI